MVLRRPQAVAAAGIFIIVLGTLTYVSSSTYYQPGSSFGHFELSSYFGQTAQCPDPLLPAAPLSKRQHVCQPLSTRPELGLTAQVCFAPDVVNQGYFLIARSSAEECAALDKKTVSLMPDENTLLRMRGPDTFHISIDGEQHWGTETDPEYLGSCHYKFPFNLAFAGPMNVTIWWEFSGYRAIDETEVMSLQWDLAEYVLEGHSQVIKPLASIAQGCPHVSAIPTVPEWRSAKDETYLASVPECPRNEATKGRYLRAHYTEPHTFNGFMFQPDGCKWSNPIRIDAPPEEVQRDWKPHNILFWGDSHVRYAYDIMGYMYAGNWTQYKQTPVMKALKKVTTIGPINMTFLWDAVLREMKFDLSCENIKEYDTIVLGSSHHNLVLTNEADHDRQFTVHDFGLLLEGLAKKLSPDACPGQKMPRIIWIGSPARPVKLALPPKQHPLNHGWRDARVNPRLTRFNHVAWEALRHLPGAARVNLYDLSVGMANQFVDGLHMIMTDVQAAFVQDLHQKLWLTEPAYAHANS